MAWNFDKDVESVKKSYDFVMQNVTKKLPEKPSFQILLVINGIQTKSVDLI